MTSSLVATLEEQIADLEAEIKKTQYNKATQHHVGKLKAKIAKLKGEIEKARVASSGKSGDGYAVRKSGNATVALVGLPSVGKSTILGALTGKESEVAAYAFTTLDVVPGMMDYRFAKIQILDLPGLIKGAAKGKGRGREVLAVVRTADLILLTIDAWDEIQLDVLLDELTEIGMRLNTRLPDVSIKKSDRGGIHIVSLVDLPDLSEDDMKAMIQSFGIVNAHVTVRQSVDADQLIDVLTNNRIYSRAMIVINKIDLVDDARLEYLQEQLGDWPITMISAHQKVGIAELREDIYQQLGFINLFLKPPGEEADMEEPLVVKDGSTIENVCVTLHRDMLRNFRYAKVTGPSSKFPAQVVGLQHVLKDGDIVTLVVRK